VIPPEELVGGLATNARLGDIFQAGVLLYRLLENGEWPFNSTLDYATSAAGVRAFAGPAADRETEVLRQTAVRMLDVRPENRPELLSKLKQEIQTVLA
jgi:hypothetical protein